jgi:hypothetical protein
MIYKKRLVIEMIEAGGRPTDVAAKTGMSVSWVSQCRKEMGLPCLKPKKDEEIRAKIIPLIKQWVPNQIISKQCKCSKSLICTVRRELGIPKGANKTWPNGSGTMKNTFLQRKQKGESYASIAKDFGVSSARIQQIVHAGLPKPCVGKCSMCGKRKLLERHHARYWPVKIRALCGRCHGRCRGKYALYLRGKMVLVTISELARLAGISWYKMKIRLQHGQKPTTAIIGGKPSESKRIRIGRLVKALSKDCNNPIYSVVPSDRSQRFPAIKDTDNEPMRMKEVARACDGPRITDGRVLRSKKKYKVIEMLKAGKLPMEIIKKLGVRSGSVTAWRRQAGMPPFKRGRKYLPIRREVASMLRTGKPSSEIERELKCSKAYVSLCKKRLGVKPYKKYHPTIIRTVIEISAADCSQ